MFPTPSMLIEWLQKISFHMFLQKPILNVVRKCIFVHDTLSTNKKSLAVFNFMQAD